MHEQDQQHMASRMLWVCERMLQSVAHPCANSRRWPDPSLSELAERSRCVAGPERGSLTDPIWQSYDPEEQLCGPAAPRPALPPPPPPPPDVGSPLQSLHDRLSTRQTQCQQSCVTRPAQQTRGRSPFQVPGRGRAGRISLGLAVWRGMGAWPLVLPWLGTPPGPALP